jgi:hypothetical protein
VVGVRPSAARALPLGEGEEQASSDDGRHSSPAGANGRGCAASLRGPDAAARYATRSSIIYLGHNKSKHGISVEERKIHASNSWERPQNLVNVQSFLGMCNYYQRFVPQFARIAAPLTDLTKTTNPFT